MPAKWCPACQTSKPWSDFYAAARHPDTTMARPGAYCKACVARRARERRLSDPERMRALDAADRARIRADRDRRQRRRETQRENSRVWRLRHTTTSKEGRTP
jgi:hypothetical protein